MTRCTACDWLNTVVYGQARLCCPGCGAIGAKDARGRWAWTWGTGLDALAASVKEGPVPGHNSDEERD